MTTRILATRVMQAISIALFLLFCTQEAGPVQAASTPGSTADGLTIQVEPIAIDGKQINWTVVVCNVDGDPDQNASIRIDADPNQTPVSSNPAADVSGNGTFEVQVDLSATHCTEINVVTEILASNGPYCISASAASAADRDCISQSTLFPTTLPATGGKPVGAHSNLLLAIIGAGVLSLLAGALLLFQKRLA